MSARAMRSGIGRLTVCALALCALSLAALSSARSARADVFGGISILSANPFGQVEYAHDPALSEDGRYIVFDGSIGGVQGVWRRETRPGAGFEQVAGGDATLPSVSADGRYVSFTTNEGASLPAITDGQIPEGEPVREAPSVYVRDMDAQGTEPGAFTLVSAKNHSTQSLTYEFPGADEEEEEGDIRTLGSAAAGRSAITADGRTVAFVTTAQSDLAGPGTPPMQVAVRHLDTDETVLVSARYDQATGRPAVNPETGEPEPVPMEESFGLFGAVWAKGVKTPFIPNGAGSVTRAYTPPELPGAAISADGTAVAWYGGQISEQARTLAGEQTVHQYAEPLWRRISGGASEPTRRVTGGSDPESPGCIADPGAGLGAGSPCQGPFATPGAIGIWNGGGQSDYVPRLSANGDYVAFLASAPLTTETEAFGLSPEDHNSDVYREDMTAPDRKSGLRRLTHFASGDTNRIQTNANITDLAISPDGQQIAFTTRRTIFPLGVPAFVSAPAAVPGLDELFDADLADDTLTRVTRGAEGGLAEHPELETGNEDRYARDADGALSPSFGAGGQLLAFSSTASNLVFGDGNSPPNDVLGVVDGADVFTVPRISFSTEPTPQVVSPPPANPALEPPWRLQVSAASLKSGLVELKVRVPGAGALAVSAAGMVPVKSGHAHSRKTRRTVARASRTVHGAATTLTLKLGLDSRDRGLARLRGGLAGVLTATFKAAGHPTLGKKLRIRFVHLVAHTSRTRRHG
jgi:hypothetical protein